MINDKIAKITNFALFQCGWLLAVIMQTPWALLWALSFLLIHLKFFAKDGEFIKLLPIMLIGLGVDLIWHLSPVIHYNGVGFIMPFWIIALWIIFPLTLTHSLSWLEGRRLLQIVLGVIGGGGSYVAGTRLGAATVEWWGLAIVASAWAIWLPLFYFLIDKKQTSKTSTV